MFIIEDAMHTEPQQGEYQTFEEALEDLQEMAKIPWDQKPNKCPCTNWKNCGRKYQVAEYDGTTIPWVELGRWDILEISAEGVSWAESGNLT